MLEVNNIDVGYSDVQALWNVSLKIEKGETVSIIGSNGAGKSTIIKTIAGFLRPIKGEIRFNGEKISGLPPYEISRRGISLVPEGRLLFDKMSVKDNLILGAYGIRDRDIIEENLERVYEIFPILKEREKQIAGTLSGGEQQMLAIARGLMSRPKLLLLDEPSLGLAPMMVHQIFKTIRKLARRGLTVLLSAQNINQALRISDRGYVIESGRIIMEGTAEGLLEDPGVKSAYLGI
jgi:branched-chain amino acid transport system ATP-binding protein